jgi:nucleoside-diphosphate-sugar epimerase
VLISARSPDAEQDELFEAAADDLREFRGARLLLTGGTGFVGCSLLESILWANARLGLDISVVVLTRDAAAFREKVPQLGNADGVNLVEGDVRTPPSLSCSFDGVIHAATPASADLNRDRPFEMLDTIYTGGQAILEIAARSGEIPFLFTSSGAVYGEQPPELDAFPESYVGAPDPLFAGNAYHEGKRIGELQCAIAAKSHGLRVKIARLFAFVGPYLPIDRHFAIGNFIRDGIAGKPISVASDGSAVRTYLYSADMVVWLWAILTRGQTMRAYNVGSSLSIDIGELASTVAAAFVPTREVKIAQVHITGSKVHRYVPNVNRVKAELSVEERVDLRAAIARTIESHLTS